MKARIYTDAGLVQGGMEIGRQRRRERVQVGALLGAIVIERNRPTNPMSCFDLLRSDSRSSSDVSASKMRHRYLLRPTPVVKQPPLMPHGYGQCINELAISSSPSRTTPPTRPLRTPKVLSHNSRPRNPCLPCRCHLSSTRDEAKVPGVDGVPPASLQGERVESRVVLSMLRACMPVLSVEVFVSQNLAGRQ